MSLRDKHIVIGISGSIAAYKIATLVRLLRKAEASVQVIMTQEATQFITPLTLSTLSNKPVFVDYFDKKTDRKSTRLNSSHVKISYAVFCLKKKTKTTIS